jgi:hypothetical protein
MLKVGDALRNSGRGVYVLSVSTALRSKVITIKVPRYQLANISRHKLHPPDPSAKPSNRAHQTMARPPDVRRRRSAISVSATGSPLLRDAQPFLKSDQEYLTDSSNEKVESSSDAQTTPEEIYGNPPKPLSLNQEDSPPFHRQMSLSSFKQKMQSPSLNLQIGLSPPDWRLRQAQFQWQLDLSAYERQQGSSSWLSRQTWDTRVSWPRSSTPLKDQIHPLRSRYAPLPYNLPTEYPPSLRPILTNNQPLLPGSMSAAFAMKGPSHELHSGVHNLLASASMATNPDDSETPEEFKERLTYSIEQMMFVSGETAEASPETTGMIEEIVRAQVIEMVSSFHFANASALVISKFSRAPSHAYLPAAQTSDRACQSKRRPINFNCRPHLPHSPRQSQSLTTKNFLVVERCAEKCQRFRRERRRRRWGSRL